MGAEPNDFVQNGAIQSGEGQNGTVQNGEGQNGTVPNNIDLNTMCSVETINVLVPKKDYDIYMISNFWDIFRTTDAEALALYPSVEHIHARLNKPETEQEIENNRELYDTCIGYFREMIVSDKILYALMFHYGTDSKAIEINRVNGRFTISNLVVGVSGINHQIDVVPDGMEVLSVVKVMNDYKN